MTDHSGTEDIVDDERVVAVRVPAGVVHRDVNPLDEPQEIVPAVVGDAPLVVNLDGPAGAGG